MSASVAILPSSLQQALMIACLADGYSRLKKAPFDDTTHLLMENLLHLGVAVIPDAESAMIDIAGTGGYWPNSDAELDCRDSVSVACMLAAGCSIGRGQYTVTCTAPAEGIDVFVPLLGSLLDLGAAISHSVAENRLSINLGPGGLRGGSTEIAAHAAPCVPMSILLVAPYASNDVFVDCRRTIGHELDSLISLMDRFGSPVIHEGSRLIVPAPQRYRGRELEV